MKQLSKLDTIRRDCQEFLRLYEFLTAIFQGRQSNINWTGACSREITHQNPFHESLMDSINHVYPVAVTKVAKILVILGIHWQRVRHTIISKKPQLHKIKCRKSIWDFLLMCCITVGLLWGSMKLHRSWWKRILRDLIVCPLWKVWTLEAIVTEPHSHTVQL